MQAPTLADVRAISPIRVVPDPGTVTHVRLEGERILIDGLTVHDPALAAFLAERPEPDRVDLVARGLRIGLLALQDAGVTVNVDVVRGEFEKLVRQAESVNEKAALALEGTLRANFADGDGRLPRTLEKFLGDRGDYEVKFPRQVSLKVDGKPLADITLEYHQNNPYLIFPVPKEVAAK